MRSALIVPRSAVSAPSLRVARAAFRLAIASFIGACARTSPIPSSGESVSAPGAEAGATTPTASRPAYSLYDLDAPWRDQTGASRSLSAFRGRPVVLGMIYTHCTESCPLTVLEMQHIEKAIATSSPRVAFVLVSLDPIHDTPAQLASFAQEHGISGSRWTLLTGSADATRDLAMSLNMKVRKISADQIAHSNLVTVLGVNGEVAVQHAGFGGIDDVVSWFSSSRH
jgi:protein SCO1/2